MHRSGEEMRVWMSASFTTNGDSGASSIQASRAVDDILIRQAIWGDAGATTRKNGAYSTTHKLIIFQARQSIHKRKLI